MKILIPLISRLENDEEFIELAFSEGKEIVFLLVIDTSAMFGGSGFAASDIRQGNGLLEEMKRAAESRGKKVEDITEWGDTEQKIINIAKIQNVKKIVLKKQDNQFFEELVKKLEEEKLKVNVF